MQPSRKFLLCPTVPENLVGLDKHSSKYKAKAKHASKPSQRIHSLLPMSREVFQESRTPSHVTVIWIDKHHSKCHFSSSFLPQYGYADTIPLCPRPSLWNVCKMPTSVHHVHSVHDLRVHLSQWPLRTGDVCVLWSYWAPKPAQIRS